MFFADFEGLFGVIAKVLHIMALRAGHTQFARDRDHLLTDVFLFCDELTHRLQNVPEELAEKPR